MLITNKECSCQPSRHGFNPWVRQIPWRRKWQPILVFLPGESHGQRSLASYSPWGHKELDTTEQHIHTQGKEPEKTMYTHIAITKYCAYTWSYHDVVNQLNFNTNELNPNQRVLLKLKPSFAVVEHTGRLLTEAYFSTEKWRQMRCDVRYGD